jgi:hypothetical protein
MKICAAAKKYEPSKTSKTSGIHFWEIGHPQKDREKARRASANQIDTWKQRDGQTE